VRAGYFNAKKTSFTDLSDNHSYKCSIDDNGVLTLDGKKMIMLENEGEIYSDNYEQNRFYRPKVKAKVGNFSWIEEVRVAGGIYTEEDLWVMFANGDGYHIYFTFLLSENGTLTKDQIEYILKDFNNSAEYIISCKIDYEKDNVNSL
jgi:hypothetical protein